MSEEKFINNFSIEIGQDRFRTMEPLIKFQLNDQWVAIPLKEMRDWFNTIWDSQGDQNKKAIDAKRKLDGFFIELLHPFIDYSMPKKEIE